ncbi:MAG: hypothetical protein ACI8QG_001482, partial [Flavobacteriales bacterium]
MPALQSTHYCVNLYIGGIRFIRPDSDTYCSGSVQRQNEDA